ncbi:hypothetical protein D3C78_1642520 [compost metagenome]
MFLIFASGCNCMFSVSTEELSIPVLKLTVSVRLSITFKEVIAKLVSVRSETEFLLPGVPPSAATLAVQRCAGLHKSISSINSSE